MTTILITKPNFEQTLKCLLQEEYTITIFGNQYTIIKNKNEYSLTIIQQYNNGYELDKKYKMYEDIGTEIYKVETNITPIDGFELFKLMLNNNIGVLSIIES